MLDVLARALRMNRLGYFLLFTALAVAAASCQRYRLGQPVSPVRNEQSVTHLLLQELGRRAASFPRPDSADVQWTRSGSEIIPDLVYQWAEYYPAATTHVRFVSLAMTRDSIITLVRTPDDWFRSIGEFVAESPGEVLAACREAVHASSRRRAPWAPPYIYTEPESLDAIPHALPDPERLVQTLTFPHVQPLPGGGWIAQFWAVERTDVRKYACQLMKQNGHLLVQDSMPGLGFHLPT